ncbi:MAG: KH domain-containing protein [Dorea sp.]|jgi:spoIIIJ-associated protein|nr:KH domain-containing protein [Dorea sp.]
MDYITVSARTLDDAITEALVQLGVTSDKLDYEVIEKGSAGFLGIGVKQAVIKARKKKEETVAAAEETEEKKESAEPAEEKKERKDKYPKKEHNKKNYRNKKDAREGKGGKEYKDSRYQEKGMKEDEKEEVKSVIKKEIPLAPVQEVTIETCKKFIQDVLSCLDMKDVTVTTSVDDEGALSINMDGPDMGILIGKRGQTLDSLQYLTNRVANKMQDGYVRVKLDTEDYRRRRKQTLENLAKNIAGKVKRTRRSVFLEPMNPYERRIIHSALQSDSAVSTHSEGEEPYRRVVVTLARRY